MKNSRPALSVLALLVGAPLLPSIASNAAQLAGLPGVAASLGATGAAHAAIIRRNKITKQGTNSYRVAVVTDADAAVSGVTATIKSDGGTEDVTLVEANAWLHGGASIAALPTADAAVTLTLYDSSSAPMLSFSGTFGADGGVNLSADAVATAECATRAGCADDVTAPDVELRGADWFRGDSFFDIDTGYALAFDLAGADTYDIAYAEVTIAEPGDIGETCTTRVCEPAAEGTVVTVEVGWDEIGAVWEGDLTLEPQGIIDVKVRIDDHDGGGLGSGKAALAAPWLDGGEGVSVLAVDEDPLTTVGFASSRFGRYDRVESACAEVPAESMRMYVLSEGWTAADAMPTEAEVELTDGETVTVPADSYQRRQRAELHFGEGTEVYAVRNPTFSIRVNDRVLTVDGRSPGLEDLAAPLCASGTCVMFTDDESSGYQLSVTSYGSDATLTGDDIVLSVALLDDDGEPLLSDTFDVAFEDEVAVLFANPVCFSADPIGLDLSGKVSLLGASDARGRQDTLAKGKFYGAFSRDGDGDLELAGTDKDVSASRGDILRAGEGVEWSEGGGDEPPPITVVFHFGKGTKNSASKTSAKPELL